jgi:sugar phosphate isomerase/epimerase
VLIATTTECFKHLSFDEAVHRISDLEFTCIEITIHENSQQLTPAQVVEDLEAAIFLCHNPRRLHVVAYSFQSSASEDEFYRQFEVVCHLAKETRVVSVTVDSGELGTPFNQEVERLRKLVEIASQQGVIVGMRSQVGCLSEDPDTVAVLCDNVEGLGLTLDPSHYICGPHGGRDYDKLMKYVCHVRLRDTSMNEMQVQVGQGEIDYGRLTTQLSLAGYNRALSVHIMDLPGTEHVGELRKMRLLLESLL